VGGISDAGVDACSTSAASVSAIIMIDTFPRGRNISCRDTIADSP